MRTYTLLLFSIVGLLFTCPLQSQVTADFTSNVTSGCNTLQVSFSDLSSSTAGSITSWDWELGGVTSSSQNPGRIFGTPDAYTICLTVTDDQGNTDTECKIDYINIFNLPEPAFTVDQQFGCAPVEINFTDQSNSIDGDIEEWVWGLGGTTGVLIENGTSSNVSSTYEDPDDYTISLTVTDNNGCVNTITESDYITVFDFPVIDISLSDSTSCTTPLFVNFENNNIEPSVNYFWDFGNGDPVFEGAVPPTVLYLDEGNYTVTVIAENSLTNCTDTLVLEDVIRIGGEVSFELVEEAACQGVEVSFNNTSANGVSNYEWDFGDGNTSNLASPTHAYSAPGCYDVVLMATTSFGCVETYNSTQCIEVYPLPSLDFTSSNPQGCELPHFTQFNSTATTAQSYLWDFGDGSISNSEDPSHVYTEFGIFLVSLEVTDQNGCINSMIDTIEITELQAQMDFDVLAGCSPVNFNISENSTSIVPITSWFWSIDTSFSDPNSPLITSTDASPDFSIIDTGWYDITLIITNALGCIDTVVNEGAIGVGNLPVVDFEAAPLSVCIDEPVQFTDLSSSFADFWIWSFGDGTGAESQNTIHSYSTPDTFDISLVVSHNGCTNELTIEDYIVVQQPKALFTLDRDCGNPFTVGFLDSSTGADSVFWDFGYSDDGLDTSSVTNPIVTYPTTGCYIATQFAYNFNSGCIDSFDIELCITDPAANFNLSPTSGCTPLNVNVENNSEFAVAWEWSAPGATISDATIENPVFTYNTPGIFSDVQLVVTDLNGCQDTIMFMDSITVNGVNPNFDALPSGGCFPLEVQFLDASSSFISPIVSWSWDINNGALITEDQNTSYVFDTTGAYPASLTVTNALGCTGTINLPNAVIVTMPIASFTADTLTCPGDSILFENLSTGNSLSSIWDFDDGTFSTEPSPYHQFENPGTYNVCLFITDFAGCDQNYCQVIEIVSPIADFTVDTTYANCPPLVVNFDNQSQNAFLYEWDFGDSSGVSSQENPAHVYTIPGVYDIQLVVELNENCIDTLFLDSLIRIEGPIGNLSFDIDTACIPEAITFFGESQDAFTYIWDFGDGNVDTTFNVLTDTISHVYLEPGRYVPKLSLVDSENCLRTLESSDTITIGLLDIDFTATDSTLCEGLNETTFLNLITSSEPISNLMWTFENGSPATSTEFEPVVSFPDMGTYDVTLIAENSFCRDTLTKADFIGAGALPVASFTNSTNEGCIPFDIQFTDQSIVSDGSIVSWDWNFGDGLVSNEINPIHEYNTEGFFDVVLTVTTEFNCSDTASVLVSSYDAEQPNLTVSEPEICIGDVVQLTADFDLDIDTAQLTFYWLDDPSLSCTDCLYPSANPVSPTTYTFVSTTIEGCVDSTSIFVDVLPFTIPEITITADTTLCINESIQLLAQSNEMVSFEWNVGADSLSCYDCSSPLANPILSTNYIVTVTNSFGCDDIDSVFVEVIDQTDLDLVGDVTICQGDTTQIQLLVDGDVVWSNSNGLSCDNCSDPLAYPNQTDTYPLQLTTDDFGCDLLDTLMITVYSSEDINAGEDLKICLGESITLNATTNSPGSVLWTPSDGLETDTILNPSGSPVDTITYLLSVEEGLCTLTDSVEVIVQYLTDVESFEYVICEGDTIQISYEGEADAIEWSPAETLSDNMEDSPLAFPTETTNYLLNASLSTCLEDSAIATVIVNQAPGISDFIAFDKFPEEALQIELEVETGSGDYSYDWLRFDGLSCNNCPDPILDIDTSGFYNVIITDESNGCETEVMVFINLLKACDADLIFVPNIFTPNDDGYNDRLEIFGGPIKEINTFKVYNRWGALVYQTDDINAAWDGNFKDKKMPSGVYVYFLQARCIIDGSMLLKKGDFTLVR